MAMLNNQMVYSDTSLDASQTSEDPALCAANFHLFHRLAESVDQWPIQVPNIEALPCNYDD